VVVFVSCAVLPPVYRCHACCWLVVQRLYLHACKHPASLPFLNPGWDHRPFERRWASHSERSSGSGGAVARDVPPILAAKRWVMVLGRVGCNWCIPGNSQACLCPVTPACHPSSLCTCCARSMAAALGSRAMYLVDTGAANEHVPLNETGYLLPLWQVGGAAF